MRITSFWRSRCECRGGVSPPKLHVWQGGGTPPPRLAKEQLSIQLPSGGALARDVMGHWVVFLSDSWVLKLLESRNEDYEFLAQPL
jgi:hypothetical protein